MSQQFSARHINHLRQACQATPLNNSPVPNCELSGRFNDHYSLYDYFQDVLVNGMQDLVDSTGKLEFV